MRKIAFLITLSMAFCLLMQAQPQRPDEGKMIENRTNEMAKRYGLNKSQKACLLALNKRYPMMGEPGGGPMMGGPRGLQPPKNVQLPSKDGKQVPPKGKQQPPEGKGIQLQKNGQRPPLPMDESSAKDCHPPKMDAQMQKKMQTERASYNKQLSQIMTAAQFKRYQADERKRGQQFGGKAQQGVQKNGNVAKKTAVVKKKTTATTAKKKIKK